MVFLIIPDVPFVPSIPDSDIVPVVGPCYGKKTEAAIFKYLHAVIFYGDLSVGISSPVPQITFGISVTHNH